MFSVEIHFGLMEFKARIKWMDKVCFFFFFLLLPSADSTFPLNRNNEIVCLFSFHPLSQLLTKSHSGPAAIVYNERGHRAEEDKPDTYPEDDLS